MGVYLEIGGADVSRYITENNYSVESVPVYDEENEYVNLYGEHVRRLTGHKITVSAKLFGMDDDTVAALSEVMSGQDVQVKYSAPELKTALLEPKKLFISLDSADPETDEKRWNGEVILHTPFAADCL